MSDYFAFLASPWSSADIKELRHQVWLFGNQNGFPFWIAEKVMKDLKPDNELTPLEIVDVCMDAVRQSKYFFFVADGSFGTKIRHADQMLTASYIEMELFQAAALEKPVYLFIVGSIIEDSPLGRLLNILHFAFPESKRQRFDSTASVLEAIKRVCIAEKRHLMRFGVARRSKALVGAFASQRHSDWANHRLGQELTLLDHAFDTSARRPELDQIAHLLAEAEATLGSQRKLARVWLAIRELMGAPYLNSMNQEHLQLWDRALSQWSKIAAWYGLHAHLYLGHQAALGSLSIVRSKLTSQLHSTDSFDHTASLDGSFASCFYSLSKIAPRAQALSFLDRAERYVGRGLRSNEAPHHSGLYGLRGSIRLRRGDTKAAVADHERALRLAESGTDFAARQGVLLSELGWAEICAGRRSEGISHLRTGVELMKLRSEPGFVVRGQKKLAYGMLRSGLLFQSFQELLEANELALKHQLEDQFDIGMNMVAKIADILARAGFNIKIGKQD